MAEKQLNENLVSTPSGRGVRIVVSLKQPIFRRTIGDAIKSEPDMQLVGETGSGVEAVALCEQQPVDLLILDFDLDDISGIQLAENLSGKRSLQSIKLLGLIDFPQKHVIWGYLVNGISGIILKSRSQQEMVTVIRRVMAGEVVLDQPIRQMMMNSVRQIKPKLTDREMIILKHLAIGSRNEEISAQLQISQETLRNYLYGLKQKLPFVRDRVDMILWAWVNFDQQELFDLKSIDSQ